MGSDDEIIDGENMEQVRMVVRGEEANVIDNLEQ
ncbi:hypothetical protein OROMI_020474 [Orobanche minor]